MKPFTVLSWLGVISAGLLSMGATAPAPSGRISGDYVEVRTASVFAGPCHYNSELMTTGRDAVMAWNVKSGTWAGVDLAGVRAVAAVTSDANLGDDKGARKSELYIDSSASDAQAAALANAVRARFESKLGQIVSVRRGTVTFQHDGDAYRIDAAGFASCSVAGMPDHECCKQPNLVWYSPLVPLADRRVGFTSDASYSAGTLCDRWERGDENSAFYGEFAF